MLLWHIGTSVKRLVKNGKECEEIDKAVIGPNYKGCEKCLPLLYQKIFTIWLIFNVLLAFVKLLELQPLAQPRQSSVKFVPLQLGMDNKISRFVWQ